MNEINEILIRYKQRFISSKTISRTYFLSKINKAHSVDLVKFNSDFGPIIDFKEKILNYQNLLFKKQSLNISEAKKMLRTLTNEKEGNINEILPNFSKEDLKKLINLNLDIEEKRNNINYDENKISTYLEELETNRKQLINSLIDKYLKQVNSNFRSVEKLEKFAESDYKNQGKNDLYLGFPFIEGKFGSSKYFRAPLVLHRVELDCKMNSVTIKIIEGESIFNPVFLVAYHLENDLDHKLFNWDLESNDFLKESKNILDELKIKYIYKDNDIKIFKSCTKKDYIENNNDNINEFKVLNNFVLGLFPITDKNIYNDINDLIDMNFTEQDSIYSLFKGNENIEDIFSEYKENRINEHEIKYITNLDYSQKNVVGKSINNNYVIEGPPGTGKSQVLSNIIVNYIDKGKTILVVSEKIAALEVIYNRLGNLSKYALLVRDHLRDKESYYAQLDEAIKSINQPNNIDAYEDYSIINNQIEDIFNNILKRAKLYSNNYSGFTLEEVIKLYNQNHKNIFHLSKYINKIEHENLKDYFNDISKTIIKMDNDGIMGNIYKFYLEAKKLANLDIANCNKYFQYLYNNEKTNLKKELLFYLIFNDIYKPENTYSFESQAKTGVKKSFKDLKRDIEILLENNMVEKYSNHLRELEKKIYSYYSISSELIDLLLYWKSYRKSKKISLIKKLSNKNYRVDILKRIWGTGILNDKEREFFNVLEVSADELNPEKILINGLSEHIIEILEYIQKSNSKDSTELTIGVFNSGIYNIDLEDLNSQFCDLNQINALNIEELTDILKIEDNHILILALAMKDQLFLPNEIIKSIGKDLVSQHYLEIIEEINFYYNYSNNYNSAKSLINTKRDKSRITIENNIKERIRLDGLNNKSFGLVVNELKRISSLKRKKPVPTTTKRYTREILKLFPVCLMTPASVSATLSNEKNLFDVILFDEASQMFVEKAIPSIYRGNRIIVAGDSKQLRPSSFFTQRFTEDDLEEEENFLISSAIEEESLLDFCKNKFKSVNLRYHYRSDYKELIDYSNRAFYDNSLTFANNAKEANSKPIEIFDVKGVWSDNVNILEANKVLKLVIKILKERNNNESIGVITFNRKQMDLIEELIIEESYKNKDLAFELTRVNKETGSDESLFIKNIENVQGDERDIILFSISYSKNEEGKFYNRFGPISQMSGENRLNVAITRAKKKIYIVKSIESSIIDVNPSNRGAYFFKNYIKYCEILNKNQDILPFLKQLSNSSYIDYENKERTNYDRDDILEEIIKSLGSDYYIDKDFRVGSFYVDLGIFSKETKENLLCIDVDTGIIENTASIEDDFYKYLYLENRGWVIHQIWLTNWWSNSELELEKIKRLISVRELMYYKRRK